MYFVFIHFFLLPVVNAGCLQEKEPAECIWSGPSAPWCSWRNDVLLDNARSLTFNHWRHNTGELWDIDSRKLSNSNLNQTFGNGRACFKLLFGQCRRGVHPGPLSRIQSYETMTWSSNRVSTSESFEPWSRPYLALTPGHSLGRIDSRSQTVNTPWLFRNWQVLIRFGECLDLCFVVELNYYYLKAQGLRRPSGMSSWLFQ